ncbi:RAN protein kinase [Gaeumannomyces tritici R3-111a-1]|uniref:Autophagy-related protein 1 n=1 Tax=Gaeumannomyces tritici (strain R3-111a-1) TaxID=644352 RepID=J3PJU0_GAET3|nr:RAN protein kinase [Gaeumannomyces tritici R3-111a-1]EJT68653.1 RAN protein kinase [Gaeumannomyces tritici R3-111a-1]
MECLRDRFDMGVVLDGRYETISPLNHGSFGMVFMARDVRTDEKVAIKCLTKKAAADQYGFDFAVDEKSEELVLHKRLGSHPNIVNLVDAFETDAHVYLVLEFCERGDLYEAIRHGYGPLETEHVRKFMLELVDAVEYMHAKGVYHRDIKPENIFLTDTGSLKLGDFGLATTERWTYEATVGSDRYMSPEQYDSAGAGYSPAQADIWAIGICLLNVLFSRNPFTTPTEADLLFLDFSRDKQSLFDVFPYMSQDTYEVIVECMNLDPNKRSLVGARRALRRVVSFTTTDEALDDFCSTDRTAMASANREPLRTPSIQSPAVDTGAFPWAKALQITAAMPIRQLSMIPDNECYTEDLFSKSEATNSDWFSNAAQTPSVDSMLNSSLGASISSLGISNPQHHRKVSPMAGSLPITMSRSRAQPAMSSVFGHSEGFSKSWSDMWEEDEEEEANERARQMTNLKELNSRTWSHESQVLGNDEDEDDTPRRGLSPATKASTLYVSDHIPSIENTISNNIDDDLVADGFFFQDDEPEPESKQGRGQPTQPVSPRPSSRYSPPPKRNDGDKWEALGQRRRGYSSAKPAKAAAKTSEGLLKNSRPNQQPTFGFSTLGHGVWDYNMGQHHHSINMAVSKHANDNINTAFNNHGPLGIHQNNGAKWTSPKDRSKDGCPWKKGIDSNWRRDRRADLGVEWVGGW